MTHFEYAECPFTYSVRSCLLWMFSDVDVNVWKKKWNHQKETKDECRIYVFEKDIFYGVL